MTIDLNRIPISGVDTVEDSDTLARRIIHEWRKTRDEYRPKAIKVDLNTDLSLYRLLKTEGLPVEALPEAESRNRRSDRSRRYPQYYGMSEELDSLLPSGIAVQVASKPSKKRHQPHNEGKACLTEGEQEQTPVLSRPESERDTLQVRKYPFLALYRMIASLFGGGVGSGNSQTNDKDLARRALDSE